MIELKEVFKNYGSEKITFSNIKFKDRKSYVILGPSGCGKSTLLNLISGNIKATSGSIEVNIKDKNYNLNELSNEMRQAFRRDNISYVSQEFNLFDDFTVYDNLKLLSEVKSLYGSIQEALDVVGLTSKVKTKVKHLSGGQKQRVCIARALLQKGNIILCDEPTASLNQSLAKEIIELLIQLQKSNNSILLVVTHDEGLAKYFDEVIRYEDYIKLEVGGEN